LCSAAVQQGQVRLEIIAFDSDCPATHGTSTPAPEEWHQGEMSKLAQLHDAHPGVFYYRTRGGYRLVWRQAVPTVLRSESDARSWRQDYLICCAYLRRCFGIEADPSCADWTRLFRLPRATRTPGGEPENWLTIGNPDAVGAFSVEPSEADLAYASKTWPKAFGVPRTLVFDTCTADGQGVLFHALRARGSVVRAHGGAFVIRCPRESQHSCGRAGDGSTLLYLPAAGEQVGAIHCLHAHCAGLSVRDWLSEFSREELDAARVAAGIRSAA
jgi:hypothetical protein